MRRIVISLLMAGCASSTPEPATPTAEAREGMWTIRDTKLFVRDMGPEANARLRRKYPGRVPLMLLRLRDDQQPTLVPYEEGVRALWPGSSGSG